MVSRLRVSALLVLTVVLGWTALPAAGAIAPISDAEDGATGLQETTPSAAQAQANNSTSHHEDPNNISGDGDLAGVSQWLSNRLSDRLSESAIQLDQGQYDRAKSVLGDDYDSRLDQFVDVAGDTDSESDDESSETYRDAQRDQRNLSEAAESYEETYESYQEAIRGGNETAARQYARRLQRLEDDVERLNRSLLGEYRALENQTGLELDRAITSIVNVSENISARQRQIDEELFTATDLDVTTESTTISYADPLVASGRVQTESGAPVANQTIRIQVYRQVKRVETDSNGRFRLRYRPRQIPVDRSAVTLRYVPENSSEFLASNATVDVDIEQVTATLSIERAPAEIAYRGELDTEVRLEFDDEPVTDIPVRASIGSRRFRVRETNDRGIATFGDRLPASIPDGEHRLSVTAGSQNAAVVAQPVNRSLQVRPTETTLSVHGAQTAESQLAIDGNLSTADGLPVSDQPVQITIANSTEQLVRTDANGSYGVVFDASQLDSGENDSVPVTVTFSGQGTNLDSSTTTTQIDYQRPSTEGGDGTNRNSRPIPGSLFPGGDYLSPEALLGLGILLTGLLVLGLRRRITETEPTSISSGTQTDGEGPAEPTNSAADANTETSAPSADTIDITAARAFLRDGNPQAAVQYTYQHLRRHVADRFDVVDSDTHWEFFNKCRENGMTEEQLKTTLALVETYEAVKFKSQSNLDIDVEALLEAIGDQWPSATWSGE